MSECGRGNQKRTGNKSIQNAPGRRQAQKLLARIKDESGWRGNIPEEEEGIKEAGTKARVGTKRAGWEKKSHSLELVRRHGTREDRADVLISSSCFEMFAL